MLRSLALLATLSFRGADVLEPAVAVSSTLQALLVKYQAAEEVEDYNGPYIIKPLGIGGKGSKNKTKGPPVKKAIMKAPGLTEEIYDACTVSRLSEHS